MLVRFQRFPLLRPAWENVVDFERDVDSLFDTFLGGTVSPRTRRVPAIEMHDAGHQSVIAVELPGVAKEDIKISVDKGMLTISGERKAPGLPEGSRALRNEISHGTFVRTLELPHPVKMEAISAELNNGILRVVLPKAEEARPRAISIK
jgi:HSP20 family protein